MMKAKFPGYYRPTEADFKQLWSECIFATDANVLLNLYGYSELTRAELLGLLGQLSSRIHIPYQFAWEYQRNRCRAIMEQVKNYVTVERTLKTLYDQEFRPKHKHPFLDEIHLKAFESIQKCMAENRVKLENLFENDPYFDRVSAIIQTLSESPSTELLENLHQEAKKRYSLKIPPGYADSKDKGEPAGYGDFVGWWQLKDISKKHNKPIIFVTDDAKEDWWQIHGDRTIGPRPELISEFETECNHRFYMYSSDQFMFHARKYISDKINPQAIEEIKDLFQERLRESADSKPKEAKADNEKSDERFSPVPKSELKNTKANAPSGASALTPKEKA